MYKRPTKVCRVLGFLLVALITAQANAANVMESYRVGLFGLNIPDINTVKYMIQNHIGRYDLLRFVHVQENQRNFLLGLAEGNNQGQTENLTVSIEDFIVESDLDALIWLEPYKQVDGPSNYVVRIYNKRISKGPPFEMIEGEFDLAILPEYAFIGPKLRIALYNGALWKYSPSLNPVEWSFAVGGAGNAFLDLDPCKPFGSIIAQVAIAGEVRWPNQSQCKSANLQVAADLFFKIVQTLNDKYPNLSYSAIRKMTYLHLLKFDREGSLFDLEIARQSAKQILSFCNNNERLSVCQGISPKLLLSIVEFKHGIEKNELSQIQSSVVRLNTVPAKSVSRLGVNNVLSLALINSAEISAAILEGRDQQRLTKALNSRMQLARTTAIEGADQLALRVMMSVHLLTKNAECYERNGIRCLQADEVHSVTSWLVSHCSRESCREFAEDLDHLAIPHK